MPNTSARMLGRRAPKNAPALRASRFLTGVIPKHPAAADNLSKATYGLYDNDTYGVCGPTSVANQRRQVTAYLTGTQETPSQNDVFDLYRRSGNPAFDPADPGGPGDSGVDMQTMLEEVQHNGIGGKKCVAFAKIDVQNVEEVRAWTAIFGGLLLGVNLLTAQRSQQGTWNYERSGEWGGHAVFVGGYDPNPELISWAEKFETTPSFWSHQAEEAWGVIWPEHLGTAAFQQGVDKQALASAYTDLTGRPFPSPVPVPQPAPGEQPQPVAPSVDDADRALATHLRPWVNEHHYGQGHLVSDALRAWLAAKGL
jgi:hypothetical protein